jgi:ribosomal protein S18 acetylase RimI-like enzyme
MEGARQATDQDLPRVAELAEAAIDELSAGRGGALWSRREARSRPVLARLEKTLGADDELLLVGTIDDAVVGYGMARVEVLRDGASLGVVDDIYVEPLARGVGVGEAVMSALVEWCAASGCIGVDSIVLPGDRASKNFFESFGLVARAIIVHKSL